MHITKSMSSTDRPCGGQAAHVGIVGLHVPGRAQRRGPCRCRRRCRSARCGAACARCRTGSTELSRSSGIERARGLQPGAVFRQQFRRQRRQKFQRLLKGDCCSTTRWMVMSPIAVVVFIAARFPLAPLLPTLASVGRPARTIDDVARDRPALALEREAAERPGGEAVAEQRQRRLSDHDAAGRRACLPPSCDPWRRRPAAPPYSACRRSSNTACARCCRCCSRSGRRNRCRWPTRMSGSPSASIAQVERAQGSRPSRARSRTAATASAIDSSRFLRAIGTPHTAMMPSPAKCSTMPPCAPTSEVIASM